jgi:hypothetical protein
MAFMLDLSNVVFPDVMDTLTAGLFLGCDRNRIKALYREGKIEGEQDEAGRYLITKKSLEAYKATAPATSERTVAGGKTYVIKLTPDQLQPVKDALSTFGVELKQRYVSPAQRKVAAKASA